MPGDAIHAEVTMISTRLATAVLTAVILLGLTPATAAAREGVALLVGNADYQGTVPKAPFAIRDALMMRRQALTRFGYEPDRVIMLTDATRARMQEALGTGGAPAGGLAAKIRPGETSLIFYYSGHCVPGVEDARAYLLPVDAVPDTAASTGIALRDLYAALQALQPRTLTVALDCGVAADSFTGPLLSSPMAAVDDVLLPPDGNRTIVLAAATAGQIANADREAGLGLFTRYLLLGLDGAADTGRLGNQDGRVTLGEVQSWLTEEMGYAAKRRFGRVQRPFIFGPPSGVLAVASPSGWPPRPTLAQMRNDADRLVQSPNDFDPAPLLVPTATPAPPTASPPAATAAPPSEATTPPSTEAALEPLEAAEPPVDPAAAEKALDLTRAQRVAVQQSLSRAGHGVGSADGSFGPVTRRAIADWQRISGHAPTGYLTEEQLTALSRPE
jgi:hypothetical protein